MCATLRTKRKCLQGKDWERVLFVCVWVWLWYVCNAACIEVRAWMGEDVGVDVGVL